MLTLTDIEAAMDKARARRDAARAEAERSTQLLAAYADQLQALTELRRVTQKLVELDPPALALFDAAMAQAGEVPGGAEERSTCPLVLPSCSPASVFTGWKRRARTTAPEPGADSCAGKVLAWLRANWCEDGHTNPEIATGVRGTDTRGWVVSTQLSGLYYLGLLQRRVLVPKQPGGKFAYRALRVDKTETTG